MAYAFERLRPGAAQTPGVPWEKSPVRDGTIHLLVGLGGSGLDLLREAKGLIQRLCHGDQGRDSEPERVVVLGIDTDSADLGGSWICADGTQVCLTEQEQLYCPGMYPNGVGGRVEDARRQLQAQGMMLGHRIMNRIHPIAGGHVQVCHVYLLAGTAGGTGGLAPELAYTLREMLRWVLGPAVTVRVMGYLLLMEAYNAPGRRIWPHMPENAAACLEKLERLSTLRQRGESFRESLSTAVTVDTDEPPFDGVHFLGERFGPDPYRDCAAVAAENILAFAAEEERPDDAVGFWPGRLSRLYSSFPSVRTWAGLPDGGSCETLTVGAAAWEFPEEALNGLLEREFLDILREQTSPKKDGASELLRLMGLEYMREAQKLTAGIAPLLDIGTLTVGNTFGNGAVGFEPLYRRRQKEAFEEIAERERRMRDALDDEIPRVLDRFFTEPALGPLWVGDQLRKDLIPELLRRIDRYMDTYRYCEEILQQCQEERRHISSRLLRTNRHAMQFGETWNREFETELTMFAIRLLTDGRDSLLAWMIRRLERIRDSRYRGAELMRTLHQKADVRIWNPPAAPGWDVAVLDTLTRDIRERVLHLDGRWLLEKFYTELLERTAEGFNEAADMAALAREFLREMLWEHGGWSAADCLRETFGWGAELRGLLTELRQRAVPQLRSTFVPFAADVVLITVPADCPEICEEAESFAHADGPLSKVVRSKIPGRISVQRIPCGVRVTGLR